MKKNVKNLGQRAKKERTKRKREDGFLNLKRWGKVWSGKEKGA
jgi:hypothetical protein